jgi:hypothetical protein
LIIAIKIALYVDPRSDVFATQSYLDSGNKMSGLRSLGSGDHQHSLAANECGNTRKIGKDSTTLSPHANEELGSERVDLLEVQEERLEGGGCGIYEGRKFSHINNMARRIKTYSQVQISPNVLTTIPQPR